MATIEKIEKDIVKTKEKIAELQKESPRAGGAESRGRKLADCTACESR